MVVGEGAEQRRPRFKRAFFNASHLPTLPEVVVTALEHDNLEVVVPFDVVHEDIQFGEHSRVEEVQRRIADDDAPVGRGLADDGEKIGVGTVGRYRRRRPGPAEFLAAHAAILTRPGWYLMVGVVVSKDRAKSWSGKETLHP